MYAINWKPNQMVTDILVKVAEERRQSPEAIITEAVMKYLDLQYAEHSDAEDDPLIGLFSGTEDLSEKSENILQEEITWESGWTWKKTLS
jgi:hypothetical protein